MIRMALLLSLFVSSSAVAFAVDKLSVRKLFYAAADDNSKVGNLQSYLQRLEVSSQDAVIRGYIGTTCMLQAKIVSGPREKLHQFVKGREILEKAIADDPENIELRFLRLCVQQNAPFFLNYSSNVNADKAFLSQRVNQLTDEDLRVRIKKYQSENQ